MCLYLGLQSDEIMFYDFVTSKLAVPTIKIFAYVGVVVAGVAVIASTYL